VTIEAKISNPYLCQPLVPNSLRVPRYVSRFLKHEAIKDETTVAQVVAKMLTEYAACLEAKK